MSVAMQTKVRRYWPGKAPAWADEVHDGGDVLLTTAEPSHTMRKDDPRLRRLAKSSAENRMRVREDRRMIRQPEIDEIRKDCKRARVPAEIVSESEDEDAMQQKRRKIRAKLLMREETAPLIESESESDSESEYEIEESELVAMMVKAVYVPKSSRSTIAERERVEAEAQAVEEESMRRIEARKKETKSIVVDKIKEDFQIHKQIAGYVDCDVNVDDDDSVNEAEEYEAWKGREISRLKRNTEASMVKKKVMEERKNFTKATTEPQRIRRFLQRYYHKGVFFLTEADNEYTGTAAVAAEALYSRDFSCPTGEDKMDKTILPRVMQVKRFGLRGRTKWTHLVNEDTTHSNAIWIYNDALRAKYNKKMAGMNASMSKPKGNKKLKDWESQ